MISELLNEKRLVGDDLSDAFINNVFSDNSQKIQLQQWLTDLKTNKQLDHFSGDTQNGAIFNFAKTLPAWANPKLMQQGAELFARYNEDVLSLLGLLSLPYCYAAADGAMVLYLSDRMRTDIGKRLYETAAFVWDVMNPDAFTSEGNGFAAILKVKLMHAAVRYYTLKSGKWNNAWGFPINQEDMAGTNLSFSLIVIRGLRKFGYTITYAEQSAYIHLWNVIGHLSGLDRPLLPDNGKQAFRLEEAIRVRQFRVSEQGRSLAASLIAYFHKVNDLSAYTNEDIDQLVNYLLGDEIAALLGLNSNSLPEGKIRLIRLKNFINQSMLSRNSRQLYGTAFSKFKHSKPNS